MKVVFLDRDGVINEFPGNGNYVTRVKDFHFIPRSLEALKILTEAGHDVVVISNQAGVGKGVFSQDKLTRITRHMMEGIEATGGKIKKVFYCTHRSDAGCACRKPDIGSVRKALRHLRMKIDPAAPPFFVGDTKVDIETGFNAGCKTIFVLSGRENRRYIRGWVVQPDYIAKDLFEATKIIVGTEDSPYALRRRHKAPRVHRLHGLVKKNTLKA